MPRRGFVVAPFTHEDVRDLFWAQAQLARELAARAAKKITPEQVALLETNVEQFQEAVATGDRERIAELGYAFHRTINLAADSHRLALLLGAVVNHLPNRFYASIQAQAADVADEHQQLAEALRQHDAHQARSVMEQHIVSGADHLIEILEARGLWRSHGTGARESASLPRTPGPKMKEHGAMSRRAKIVCTLGPATSSPEQVAALVAASLDVARLNMSHGDHATHRAAYDAVRAACDASGRSVGVLVDLQGPKIRLGRFAAGPVTLAAGQEFTITGEDVPGDQSEVSCSYLGLAGDDAAGGRRSRRARGDRGTGDAGRHPGTGGRPGI